MLDKNINKISTLKLALIISLIYVIGATIVCYMDCYNHYIYPPLDIILYILFLPAIIFPNLILYAEGNGSSSISYILVCQTITFIGLWFLIYVILKSIRKN